MARAYSIDLRERVIGAIQGGASCHQAAAQFRVAVSTAVLWAQRFRATGSAAPAQIGGYRPKGIRGEPVGQDQHGAAARMGTARCAIAEQSALWSLEHDDLHRRSAA